MNVTSIGDMAQGLMLRSRTAEIKGAISQLTHELSSGQVKNVAERVGGDFAYLAGIDKNLAQLNAFNIAANEAKMFTDVAQESLDRIQNLTTAFGADVIATIPSQLSTVRESLSTRAQGDLQQLLTTLNTNIAGRNLFSGTATDTPPMGDVDDLLTALSGEVSGLTDANDIRAATEAWFADPAGFRATMYSGSDTPLAPIDVGPGEEIQMTLMADDQTLKDLMQNMALTALATDPALALDVANQNALILDAGEGLLSEQDDLAALRSDLGYAQSQIEQANARNSASVTSFEIARATLLASDPYDTATQLDEAQSQLESLYAATVRTSRLSILRFL